MRAYFWGICFQQVGALMDHPDETGVYVQCADPGLLKSFWSMFGLLAPLAPDGFHRAALFRGDIRRLIEVRERFPDPKSAENASADARRNFGRGANNPLEGLALREMYTEEVPS